jgi:hypothetical protein
MVYELSLPAVLRRAVAMESRPWDRAADLGVWSLDEAARLDGAPSPETDEPQAPPFGLHGRLRATFEPLDALEGTAGRIELTGAAVAGIPVGPAVVPTMSVQLLTATLTCRDRRCRIENLRGDGPDGQIAGDGTVTIRHPFAASALDGTLSLTLTEAAVQRGGDTLRAVAPPGTALRLLLSGSAAHPQLSVAQRP